MSEIIRRNFLRQRVENFYPGIFTVNLNQNLHSWSELTTTQIVDVVLNYEGEDNDLPTEEINYFFDSTDEFVEE